MKAGDLVLIAGTDFPSMLQQIGNIFGKLFNLNQSVKYTHCGIMVNENEIVEALSQGVVKRKFEYTNGFIIATGKFSDAQINSIVSYALESCGQKYNWFLVVSLAVLKILHLEWLFKGIGHTGQICSVLVGRCYFKAGYLFNNEGLDLLDPSDIAENVLKNKEFWHVN